LIVDNGPAGAARISSAVIAVNGVEIFKQSSFNQQVSHLEAVLTGITPTNQVSVQLTSSPGGTLALAVIGVMSCGIRIQSPASGAILTDPEVRVRGTIPLSYGIGAGVSVNGSVASVTPGKFAAFVPVDNTVTALTAVATDAAGHELSHDTIPVTVQIPDTPSGVGLRVSPYSGLAPLTVTFRLGNDVPVSQVSIDFDGDGVTDFSGASIDGHTFTYTQPGLYLPSATAIDTSGVSHKATAVVMVPDRNALESLLQVRWGAMRDALRSGDVAAASQSISEGARSRYVEAFNLIAADLPDIDSILKPVSLIEVRGRTAILEMLRTDASGVEKSFEVRWALDDDGIWRLWTF
jgi:hypothetical protein